MPLMHYKRFTPSDDLSLSDQLAYSVNIVEKHRQEARILRQDTYKFKLSKIRSEKETEIWKEKYIRSQEELKKAQQEIDKLKQEIEKLVKTNSRYQVSLFDHGNFKQRRTSQPSRLYKL